MKTIKINLNKKIQEILGVEYPIVQAPMNWLTDANLVSAVSNSGGLGVIGPNSGTLENKDASSETKLKSTIQETKKLTDNPFGVNILVPQERDHEGEKYAKNLIQVSLEEGIKIFVAVGEINENIIKMIKDSGATLLYRQLTPTVEGSKRLEQLGVDVLVVTGYDEGGLLPQNRIGTFSILPSIASVVDTPILVTGGINDINSVRAAFALGADGVYLGTRFLVAKEAPTAENIKQFIINSRGNDLVQISEMQRSLPNNLVRQMENDNLSNDEKELKVNESGGLLSGMRQGDFNKGIISVNTGIDVISEISSVSDIIENLMQDFIEEKIKVCN